MGGGIGVCCVFGGVLNEFVYVFYLEGFVFSDNKCMLLNFWCERVVVLIEIVYLIIIFIGNFWWWDEDNEVVYVVWIVG